MTWNGTKTWAVGDGPWSASIMNQYIRDNIQYGRDTQRIALFNNFLTGNAAASGSFYVDIPGLKVTFNKKNANTHLVAKFRVQCWCATAAGSGFRFGINLSGGGIVTPADTDGALFFFNQLNVVKDLCSSRFWLAQQPVGHYVLQARAKLNSGTGSLQTNTTCWASMEVSEDAVET